MPDKCNVQRKVLKRRFWWWSETTQLMVARTSLPGLLAGWLAAAYVQHAET
jgi:hypothetical protein